MRRSPLTYLSLQFPARSVWTSGVCVLLFAAFGLVCPAVPAQTIAAPSGESGPANTVVSEPYLVFVAEEAAHLRCGPSGEYYRTDPLRHGQELEVYVETEDGWLGVRPTEDSFCWIPADATQLVQSDLPANVKPDAIEAEIIEDKTVAWIGTNLGRARRYRWQVQLGEGEIVTILGRSERDGPDGPQTWYRIVPPSGEFRWIHQDQVATTAEELIASLRNEDSGEPVEFLPAGPSSISNPSGRADRIASASRSGAAGSGLRRVSDDQPYRENSSDDAERKRLESLAEIRRLDEIERNIEARRRSRFDRESDDSNSGSAIASDSSSANAEHIAGHESDAHHPRSFSQRVTDSISSLIGGRKTDAQELEPSTQSSRRLPDLVPIGSGLASNYHAPAETYPSEPIVEPTAPAAANTLAEAAPAPSVTLQTPSALPNAATPAPKTVAATAHPEFRSGESQIAIMSAPRLVARSEAPLTSPNSFVTPRKLRTITAAQIEEVQQAVASSSPESLPMIMSSLMARGASAPEIRLVADAAQRFSMHDLAQRARDYESLARRRDGDTVVSTQYLGTPSMIASTPSYPVAPSYPVTPHSSAAPAYPAPASSPTTGGNFVARTGGLIFSQSTNAIVPTSHTEIQPIAAAPTAGSIDSPTPAMEQSGTLVEVYSADPNRPPYAITDQGGQTLAYVTPAPGVDLKKHLGSRVRVQGESGFLQGLDTPHVLATAAERLLR
ncbi:SH3 domain-containing protein [Aporhodopirellula aestuarii]|uniref:Secreted protein n=1 Tax=Aporhodopirellula aestuarii TaxID=2950107 RepID=A0ABT0U543_9BACT|nr:hypothetical protein [Aporhodopirellula aestuarii]MCM2371471.1 hypothetical protein [Aporhodopirellula aestuarii]